MARVAETEMSLLLGVDGGGTKTVAALCNLDGGLVGAGRAGSSNYQVTGASGAGAALKLAVDRALAQAGAGPSAIAAAGLGLSGFDGPKEQAIVRRIVEDYLPLTPRLLENDSILVLRAGTPRGVGVGLVAGTGVNCIGRTRDGRRLQIGGMGPLSGDAGDAADLLARTVAAAWRSSDGRRPAGALAPRLLAALGLSALGEILDRLGTPPHPEADLKVVLGELFSAADRGEVAAQEVIEEVAGRLAEAATAAILGLGLEGDDARVVFGGAMLQLPAHHRLPEAVARRLSVRLPSIGSVTLSVPPVIGGLLFAADLLHRTDAIGPRLLAQGALVNEALEGGR